MRGPPEGSVQRKRTAETVLYLHVAPYSSARPRNEPILQRRPKAPFSQNQPVLWVRATLPQGEEEAHVLTPTQSTFLNEQRVARLATADRAGAPHIVPVCYVLDGASVYIALDAKPKRVPPLRLKRVRNIAENAEVSLLVDRYGEDWSQLGWVRLDGRAELIVQGREHADALRLLRQRYVQYESMLPDDAVVIAVRVHRVASWGHLSAAR